MALFASALYIRLPHISLFNPTLMGAVDFELNLGGAVVSHWASDFRGLTRELVEFGGEGDRDPLRLTRSSG